MAKIKMELGATLETVGSEELPGILRDAMIQAEERERAHARAITWLRLPVLAATPAASAVTLRAQPPATYGPRDGFVWQVRRLIVSGISTTDQIGCYFDENSRPPEWVFGATTFQATFSKFQLTVRDGQQLLFNSIGTYAGTAQVTVTGEVVEVPTVMLGKLA